LAADHDGDCNTILHTETRAAVPQETSRLASQRPAEETLPTGSRLPKAEHQNSGPDTKCSTYQGEHSSSSGYGTSARPPCNRPTSTTAASRHRAARNFADRVHSHRRRAARHSAEHGEGR
jgi:hypothetical protein